MVDPTLGGSKRVKSELVNLPCLDRRKMKCEAPNGVKYLTPDSILKPGAVRPTLSSRSTARRGLETIAGVWVHFWRDYVA